MKPAGPAQAANTWREGLAAWDLGPERVRALKNSAHFAVYTPGSDAGISTSILANLQAPQIPWEGNKELLREKIAGTVTALLGLVGLKEIDPVRSREHILLSNLFEHAWSQGRDLNLSELILQTQNPPFEKLGVFDIGTFFPEKERFELAMLLNNILAAPSFQAWIEGQPLDIGALLYAPDGRPRHSIFYLAHLGNEERMFFVTLLYASVETWMRAQTGTASLRTILYFDEIYGYMPPVSNPPSKTLMLRMLKQGRAFGVGQVLVTQNPADLDYKALSNAGSWFIGKLQTENDKNRLLDGLEGSAPGLDRQHYDDLIAALGKREFLLHNVHASAPQVFTTRWAMNYLAGPLTRVQIPALNQLAGAVPAMPAESFSPEGAAAAESQHSRSEPLPVRRASRPDADSLVGSLTHPPVPSGIEMYFLANNLTLAEAAKTTGRAIPADAHVLGLLYRPVLVAQANVRYLQRKYKLDHEQSRTAIVTEPERRGTATWEDWLSGRLQPEDFDRDPVPEARFEILEAPFNEAKSMRALQADFRDWVFRKAELGVRANEKLEVYAGPKVSQAEFRRSCAEIARQRMAAEIEKVENKFNRSLDTLEDRLRREERELQRDESDLSQRRLEEMGTHAENMFSVFSKRRRRLSTSLSKRRMTEQAKARVEGSEDAIEDFQQQIEELENERVQALQKVKDTWVEIADDMEIIPVYPYKKDILVDYFGVAWMPFYRVESQGRVLELPGFDAQWLPEKV